MNGDTGQGTQEKGYEKFGECTEAESTEYRRMVNDNEYGLGIFGGIQECISSILSSSP